MDFEDCVIVNENTEFEERLKNVENLIENILEHAVIIIGQNTLPIFINIGVKNLTLIKDENFDYLNYKMLQKLYKLEELTISFVNSNVWCGDIPLGDIYNGKLKTLKLCDFKKLSTFRGLETFKTLEKIHVENCYASDFFKYAKNLPLKNITIKGYEYLDFNGIHELYKLEELTIKGKIPDTFFEQIQMLPIKKLYVYYINENVNVSYLENMKEIEELAVDLEYKQYELLDIVCKLPKLKRLVLIEACNKVQIKTMFENKDIKLLFLTKK